MRLERRRRNGGNGQDGGDSDGDGAGFLGGDGDAVETVVAARLEWRR